MSSLDLRAGPVALDLIRMRGLRADDVTLLVGASGGPKWLSLVGLDTWLMRDFLPGRQRSTPLQLLGSSIGSWRMACLAARDPLQARDRLLEAYFAQTYSDRPDAREVSAQSRQMLAALLAGEDPSAMVAHPERQLHLLVTAVRGTAASTRRGEATRGFLAAGVRNLVSPALLSRGFERLVFHGAGPAPCTTRWRDQPTRHLPLTAEDLPEVLLASGSIPLLLEPVRLPQHSDAALYDGGLLDYHPLPRSTASGLVLYPHFRPALVPGWFDKALRWRHSPPMALTHTLLIAPSESWVRALPHGRIPDRRDFARMTPAERSKTWRRVVDESARLGDDLAGLVARGTLDKVVRPFS